MKDSDKMVGLKQCPRQIQGVQLSEGLDRLLDVPLNNNFHGL